MKNNFQQEASSKNIQKLRTTDTLPKEYIDTLGQLTLANLSDQQCQKYHQTALFHREATKLDQYDLLNRKRQQQFDGKVTSNKCECCKIVQGEKLSIFTNYEKFASLGMGVLLFFYFCEIIIVLSCLYFVIFSISSMVMNAKGNQDAQAQKLVSSFYTRGIYEMFSIEKNFKNEDVIFLQSLIGLLWCILFVIIERIGRAIGEKKGKKFDQQIFTPSDLTIKIQNLPPKNYTKQELAKFLVEKMGRPDFQIKKIFIAYQISNYNYMMRDLEDKSVQILQLKKNISKSEDQHLKKNKTFQLMQKYKHFYEQLQKLKNQIAKFHQDEDYRKNLVSGCCLIRVNNQYMKDLFLEKFQTDMIGSVGRFEHDIFSYCGFAQEKEYLKFKGNQLEITRAPQPFDIIWENCRYQKTLQTNIGIWVATIIILCADFVVLLMLMFLQFTLQKYNANISQFFMVLIQISLSLATIFLNNILYFTISFMITLENHHTKTEMLISKTQKLILSQFLNTILLPILAVKMIVDTQILPPISSLILSYSIVNAVVQNLLTIFSKDYVIKCIVLNIKCIRNLVIRYYAGNEFQFNKNYIQRLNQFYENEDIDMSNSYSFYISTFLHMNFFGFQEPMVILFGLIGITVNCILKKILFTERYTTPKMIDSMLFRQMMKSLSSIPTYFGYGAIFTILSFRYQNHQADHSILVLLKPKIVFIICILIGLLNKVNFKYFQKKFQMVQAIATHMTSTGELDIASQFNFYDDYHANYDLNDIFGYKEHLIEQKPTDQTLEMINEHVSLIESKLKKRPIQPPRKLKSENYTTKTIDDAHIQLQKSEKKQTMRRIELLKSTQFILPTPKKQNQTIEQQQRQTIKCITVKIQQKPVIQKNSHIVGIQCAASEQDKNIETQRRMI